MAEHASKLASRPSRLPVIGIIAAFIVLAVFYSYALPLFEGNDEGPHYLYADYVATYGALPDLNNPFAVSHEVTQPPLYYLVAAPMIAWIDRSDFDQVYIFNADLVNGILNDHTPAELAFPPQGTVLAVRILRLLSTALGCLTILLIYATAQLLFGDRHMAFLAAAVSAFNPKFIHLSSQVNNDIAVACAAALTLWVACRLMKQPRRPSMRQVFVMGACAGVAALCKYSGLALIVPVAFVILWCMVKHRGRSDTHAAVELSLLSQPVTHASTSSFRSFISSGAVCAAGFALTAGWLFLYNWVRYGHPITWSQVQAANAGLLRAVPLTLGQIAGVWTRVLSSYWGDFGYGIHFPPMVDSIFVVLACVVAAGAVIAVLRRQLPKEVSVLLVSGAASAVLFILWMRTYDETYNLRLASPAFLSFSIFVAASWLGWLPQRWKINAARALAVVGLSWAGAAPFLSLLPGYATPVYLTDSQVAGLPTQGRIRFDNGIEMVSASLATNRLNPGEPATMAVYWRATQPITQTYHLVLESFDDHNHSLGRLDMIPFAGTFATSRWRVGSVFRDDYRVPVSATQRTVARVFAGWYEHRPPYTLVRVTGSDAVSAQVAQVKVRGPAADTVQPSVVFSTTFTEVDGVSIALEGYDVTTRSLTLYWRSAGEPSRNYTVFVHELDATGAIMAQADAPIAYPTLFWDAGEQILDTHVLPGAVNAASIQVGLYDPATSQRLTAIHAGGIPWPDDSAVLK